MKRTGILLAGMLVLTGCLAYAWQTLPRQQSDLYRQENLGARQDESEQTEQVVRRAQENGYAYSMLSEGEQQLYLEIRDAILQIEENVKMSS